jgi:hypothetical protein
MRVAKVLRSFPLLEQAHRLRAYDSHRCVVMGAASLNGQQKTPMKLMHKYITTTLGLAAFATGLAAPAGAQTQTAFTNDPIAIQGFSAYSDFSPLGPTTFDGVDLSPDSSDVTIAFVNTANVAATSVEFTIRSGKRTKVVVDKGTFSPGTRIVHTFSAAPEFDDTSSVHVRAVTFADGSSWGS